MCGFIQTEKPFWLDEAYSSAISRLDTGAITRNLKNRRIVLAILNLLFPKAKRMLDFGAGHGIFVRLMRDEGREFFWSDLHASNDYARGFEHCEGNVYDLVTAFEVLEHLTDPIEEVSRIMSLSNNILVSTELLPDPAPHPGDWWYFVPESGQHTSLYSRSSLLKVAERFNRKVQSFGPYHLFTVEPVNRMLFALAMSRRGSQVINSLRSRESMVESDFQLLRRAASVNSKVEAEGKSLVKPKHPREPVEGTKQ